MPFDEKRYEQEVIRPLRGRRGGLQPEEDLIARYAIGPECGDVSRLKEHLKAVRSYWNQKSTGRDSQAQVCRMLIAADEQLRRQPEADLDSPAWWQGAATRGEQRVRQIVAQLATDLAAAYHEGGRITREQLAAIAVQYPSLGPDLIDAALRQAKLTVVDDVDLPIASGLDRTSYRTLRDRLAEVGAPTIVQLLHPGITTPFALLTKFSVAGEPHLALDETALRAQITASETAADSAVLRARKAAHGVLRTGLAGGADLRIIALYQVVEELCEAKSRRLADVLLIRRARELGLDEHDAAMVVASLPTGASAQRSSPGQRVRDLLELGQLRSAEQALSALSPSDADYGDLRSVVDAAHARVEELVREASAALEARHEDDTGRLWDEAVRIAGDDDDLAARRARVPPSPPRDAFADTTQASVRLSWSPPNHAVAEVSYKVVRTEERAPTGPDDGVAVSTTSDVSCIDQLPPVARRLGYAIFASVDGRTWSRAKHIEAVVVPPVTDVVLEVDEHRVVASWKRHASAVAVRVRRTAGHAPRGPADGIAVDTGLDSFVDRAVEIGTSYFYGLIAVYTDGQHQEVLAELAIATATPCAPTVAVDALTVTPISVRGGTSRVRISWPTASGTDVRLRYSERHPVWDIGETISLADVGGYGHEALGPCGVDGADSVMEADVPTGHHIYVAFTVNAAGAIVGRPVAMGSIEPIRQLEARRAGNNVVLSWVWPEHVGLVEVVWTTTEYGVIARRISKAQYIADGACRIPIGLSGGTVRVSAVAIGQFGEATSPAVTLAVRGRPLTVSYRIEAPHGLRRHLSRQRLVQVRADVDCAGIDLVVIASRALAMPLRPEHGTELHRFTGLVLSAGQLESFEVEVPASFRRPYWIRCFLTGPGAVSLMDPPIENLRVV